MFNQLVNKECLEKVKESALRGREGTLKYEMVKWMMDVLDCTDSIPFKKKDHRMANKIFFWFTSERMTPNDIKNIDYHRKHCFVTHKSRTKSSVGDHFIPVRNISVKTGVHGNNSEWNLIPVVSAQNSHYTNIIVRKYMWKLPVVGYEDKFIDLPLESNGRGQLHIVKLPKEPENLPYELAKIDLELQRISHVKVTGGRTSEWKTLEQISADLNNTKLRDCRQKYSNLKKSIVAYRVVQRWGAESRTSFFCTIPTEVDRIPGPKPSPDEMKAIKIKLTDELAKVKEMRPTETVLIAAIDVLLKSITKKRTFNTIFQVIVDIESHPDVLVACLQYLQIETRGINDNLVDLYDMYKLTYEHQRYTLNQIFPVGFPVLDDDEVEGFTDIYEECRSHYYDVQHKCRYLRAPLGRDNIDYLKTIFFDSFDIANRNTEKYMNNDVTKIFRNNQTWKIDPQDVILITSMWEEYVRSRGASMFRILDRTLTTDFEQIADNVINKLLDDIKTSSTTSALVSNSLDVDEDKKRWLSVTERMIQDRQKTLAYIERVKKGTLTAAEKLQLQQLYMDSSEDSEEDDEETKE